MLANPVAGIVFGVIIVLTLLFLAIKILKEYERGVIFRFGRLRGSRGPGLIVMIPFIDRMIRVDLRTITIDVPTQEVITRDNVTASVNAVVYFKVVDPAKSVVKVRRYLKATSQVAQTTLRSVLGQVELDDLLARREKINLELQKIITSQTDPWGIKVSTVAIKDVELPQPMQRSFAKQAEAERSRRAKIIHAEGEFQASEKLSRAAKMLSKYPVSVQLRYFQTLKETAADGKSTTLFPVPIDLFDVFINKPGKKKAK